MADIMLSTFLQAMFDRLGSLIREDLGLFSGLRRDIEELSNTMSIILGVLADAEEKQQTNRGVKSWLKLLKEAAYDAADILDECETEALRRKLETVERVTKKVREFFSASNPVLFDLRMAHKVKEIRERLDAIAGERLKFDLRVGDLQVIETKAPEKTDSFINESGVYGREEDKEKVIDLLLNAANDKEVSVIPVVGMGGLGKTTLAKCVYNDERIQEHFDMEIWVCVSNDFDVRRLTKEILENATAEKFALDDVDVIQRRLREYLSGKKFLLVLDDMWDDNQDKWEQLKGFLQAGAMGSKIIVTTRSQKVASIMGTLPSHCLTRVSDDDCWSIFKQRAFGQGRQENPGLVDLGKEIMKKCGGIPLIAKALGSLMYFKTEESQWQSVKENEIWDVLEEDDRTLLALRLSYDDLQPPLKQCFTYCSVFPKDHRMYKEELIKLWMAEGFIEPSQGNRLMEDTGRDYFENLLWRSFFQDAEKDDNGNVVSCKMHDLMHDLAELVSEDARSIFSADGKITIPDGCRHLSVEIRGRKCVSVTLMPSNRAKKLRTLLPLRSGNGMLFHASFTHLPLCLRVLDLSNADEMQGPLNSISGLKQLRYLCLCLRGVRILPNSLSKLHNLQTLKLIDSWRLNELPRDMRKMINLRHLQMDECVSLTHMPANIGELKFLQTLPVFVVGEESGCNIRELKDLSLGGELKIGKLENIRGGGNAQEAKLSEKANIRSLGLTWSDGIVHAADLSKQSLEGLQPHPKLRCLKVESYCGERLPHWMNSSFLPNLVRLSLIKCRQSEELPPLGQLPLLKFLLVSGMDALKCIGGDFYGNSAFPSLEELTLKDMANVEEWSGSNCRRLFLRLKKLKVSECPKLRVIPCFPSLSSLEEVSLEGMANLEEWSGCNGREAVVLPRLKSLTVIRCPKLTTAIMPCFPLLSSLMLYGFEAESLPNCFFQSQLTHLSILQIGRCQNLESLSRELGNVAATLEELLIVNCPKLVSLFPEEMQNRTPCLRCLMIFGCDGLMSLRLQGLASLTYLSIDSCKNLASFLGGMHHLTALQLLVITECPELLGSLADGMEHLTSLTSLNIKGCYKVTHFPEGLKHATSLQYLDIENLPNLTDLPDWIGNLSSLQRLLVNECPNLVSLPSGFQYLTNLQELHISNCPQLKKRCEKERGEDWHKISHIRQISIIGSESPSNGRLRDFNSRCFNALIPNSCIRRRNLNGV